MMLLRIFSIGLKFPTLVARNSSLYHAELINSISKLYSSSCIQSDMLKLKPYMTNKIKDYSVKNETDAGIEVFFGDHDGFEGVLRHLPSDFVVNEITTDNTVATLSNLGICSKVMKSFNDIKNLLSEEDAQKITKFSESFLNEESEIYVTKLTNDQIDTLLSALRKFIWNVDCYVKKTDFGKIMVLNSYKKNIYYGCYTHFVLYKENIATMDAIAQISRKIQVKSSYFQIAGIKDKRAISSQMISVKHTKGDKLLKANESLRGIRIGNIHYSSQPLRIGELGGNQFQIIVRNIKSSKEEIATAINSVNEQGFLNFFGLQRFGRTEIPTLLVGKHIFAQDWKSVVESIIKPNDHSVAADVLKCRQIWWDSRNAKRALEHLHYKTDRVGRLLQGLVSENDDYEKALQWMPRGTFSFYLHSYCSYVWNCIVSRRIKKFGRTPIVGDLIIHKKGGKDTRYIHEVHFATQEMIDTGSINIHDVVLPIPGTEVILPQNEVRTMYHQVLSEDGLNMESFHNTNPSFAVRGNYRHVMARPQDLQWSLLNYDDPSLPLVYSDYLKMTGVAPNTVTTGNKVALKLKFSLLSSVYATCFIREVMKRCITEMESSTESSLE